VRALPSDHDQVFTTISDLNPVVDCHKPWPMAKLGVGPAGRANSVQLFEGQSW
jgi:hypothetical protein